MKNYKQISSAVFGLATLVTIAAFGVFLYTVMIYQKPLPNNSSEMNALLSDTRKSSYVESYKVERLTINLENKSSKRLRFIDIEVHLVPFSSSQLGTLEQDNNKHKIKDIIISTLGSMEPEELNSVSGKILAENRIKKTINEFLNPNVPVIKNIFFSVFVIQ